MIAAAIQCNWFVAPGSNDISYRAVGLGILVIGGYLALRSPRWFKHPAMGRSAQLSVGIYASLAAIAAGILAISMVPGSTGWLSGAAGDGMSDAGLFLFLSMVLLLGALLALNSTLDLCERRVNMG
ncbi:MAG: hypothetical protein ACRDFS_07515, partial [Chloroflexota bacterium]